MFENLMFALITGLIGLLFWGIQHLLTLKYGKYKSPKELISLIKKSLDESNKTVKIIFSHLTCYSQALESEVTLIVNPNAFNIKQVKITETKVNIPVYIRPNTKVEIYFNGCKWCNVFVDEQYSYMCCVKTVGSHCGVKIIKPTPDPDPNALTVQKRRKKSSTN